MDIHWIDYFRVYSLPRVWRLPSFKSTFLEQMCERYLGSLSLDPLHHFPHGDMTVTGDFFHAFLTTLPRSLSFLNLLDPDTCTESV